MNAPPRQTFGENRMTHETGASPFAGGTNCLDVKGQGEQAGTQRTIDYTAFERLVVPSERPRVANRNDSRHTDVGAARRVAAGRWRPRGRRLDSHCSRTVAMVQAMGDRLAPTPAIATSHRPSQPGRVCKTQPRTFLCREPSLAAVSCGANLAELRARLAARLYLLALPAPAAASFVLLRSALAHVTIAARGARARVLAGQALSFQSAYGASLLPFKALRSFPTRCLGGT